MSPSTPPNHTIRGSLSSTSYVKRHRNHLHHSPLSNKHHYSTIGITTQHSLLVLHRVDLHQRQLSGDGVLVRLVHRPVQNHLIHDVVHLLQIEHHLLLRNPLSCEMQDISSSVYASPPNTTPTSFEKYISKVSTKASMKDIRERTFCR